MIGKAEILPKGDNPRFIVTDLPKDGWGDPVQAVRLEPAALYEKFYCVRGDMENRIKEQQLNLFARRCREKYHNSTVATWIRGL